MMSSDAPIDSDELSPKRSIIGKWQAILLFGIVGFPLLAAYGIYQTGFWMPMNTVNKGVLLEPARSVSPLNLRDSEGTELMATGKKWRMLIPYSTDCGSTCDENLFTTRQVHIRLGEKARRIERTMVAFDQADLEYLAQEHPRLRVANLDRETFQAWLAEGNGGSDVIASGQYLLVDQEGFAMMYYTNQHHGNQLLADLKRLLKFSYEE